MAVWKSVELVQINVNPPAPTGIVNLTKGQSIEQCVPFWTMRTQGGTPAAAHQGRMAEVSFIDNSGSAAVQAQAVDRPEVSVFTGLETFVVEWDPASVSVQQIPVNTFSGSLTDISITDIGDQSTAFLIYSPQYTDAPAADERFIDACAAAFFSGSSTDIVTLQRFASNGILNGTLYVVKALAGAFTVQHVQLSISGSEIERTGSILETVDADTFLIHSYNTARSAPALRDGAWQADLRDSGSVRVRRTNAGSPAGASGRHYISVVECQNNEWSVQRNRALTLVNAVTTASITAIDQDRAFINALDHNGHPYSVGRSNSTSGNDIDDAMYAADFSADDTVRFTKRTSTLTNDIVSFEVIEFAEIILPPPPSPLSIVELNWPASGSFTGSIEGDRSASVSFFGTASFAPDVDDALTVVSASHALQADSVPTADSAATALSASHALQADSALTADSATTATSASHAVQADNAATADFATAATSASHAAQADSALTADTATTASHALDFDGDIEASQVQPGSFATGSFVFSGDVTITGTASIDHLDIGGISHILQSGSSIFGDSLDDIHQFTGSVLVSGSVIADSFVGDGAGITSIISASHALRADTASFADLAATASFVSASDVQGAVESASFVETASFAEQSLTAVSATFAAKAAVAPLSIALNNFAGKEMKLRVPDILIEQDSGERTLVSLAGYTQARLIIRVTRAPDVAPAGVILIQGSTDDTTFTHLTGGSIFDGSAGPSGSMSGTIGTALTVTSPWADITGTLAVDDVFLRWTTYSGSDSGGLGRPRVGSINLQVR